MVDLTKKIVAVSLCRDYVPGAMLYHTDMAKQMGWTRDEYDRAVRVSMPPGETRCYSFTSFYTGVVPDRERKGGKLDIELDHHASQNFGRAAQLMIAAGLPGDLPVIWEITNGKKRHCDRLDEWGD